MDYRFDTSPRGTTEVADASCEPPSAPAPVPDYTFEWVGVEKAREGCEREARLIMDKIREIDAELRHPPCQICGVRCFSQLEHIEHNGGRPWDTCSGCDPELKDD